MAAKCQTDEERRVQHRGADIVQHFDQRGSSSICAMLEYMFEQYDTVTAYSMHLVDEGDIIYYLAPSVLPSTLTPDHHVTAKLKGRFDMVVKKH